MTKVKGLLFTTVLLLAATAVKAQDNTIETTIGADFVSQYIWRGQDCGNISLQPTLAVGYQGLSLAAWGSVGIDSDDTKEFDLTLSYTTGRLTVGLTDYWFNTPEERYFLYEAHRTSHVFEAFLGYDFGPLSATWYTNFAGNDGLNNDGRRAYSSYLELAAPFRLATCQWQAELGIVPYATTTYDTTGFAVTNVALKATRDIRVTDSFTLPLFAQIAANPCAQRAYLVVGFTLQP